MLNEYELQQAAADRARYCAPAAVPAEPHVPANPETTPQLGDLIVVHRDSIEATIRRLDSAMRKIPLGPAEMGLDDAYIDVCVAWAHARHMLRGTRPNAGQPLSDLEPETVPQLRLVERTSVSVDEAMRQAELEAEREDNAAFHEAGRTAALIERGSLELEPCPGCVERCGQCS